MTENRNSDFDNFLIFVIGAIIAMTLFTCESRQRIGAKCRDGSNSYATGSGACSDHGGVRHWKYEYWWD